VYLIVLTVLISLGAGLITWLVTKRWPRFDLTAPKVESTTLSTEVRRHPRVSAFLRSRRDPSVATGLALSAAIIVVVGGVVAVALLLVMIHTNTGFARFDQSASRFGAHHASPLSSRVLNDLSLLGGTVVLVPLTVIVAAVETRRLRRYSMVGFLALAVGGEYVIANLTKWMVGRSRPTFDQLAGFSGSSFPSGHATAAAASFAALALVIGRRRSPRVQALLAGVAVGLAVAIALTRVWLGVHWLTDVLAGLALGWAWFAVASITFGGRQLRFGAPIEVIEQVGPPHQRISQLPDESSPPSQRSS
jgi:membrane-associated phospholipid phosphatase